MRLSAVAWVFNTVDGWLEVSDGPVCLVGEEQYGLQTVIEVEDKPAAMVTLLFDYQLPAFLTNPPSVHSSEPTPLCTKNNPVGSYFFFIDASRA